MRSHRRRHSIVEISCEEVWLEISNFVDGDVTAELKSRIESHLKNCKHCAAVFDGTRNTVRLLTDGDFYPLPGGFADRLYARLMPTRKRRPGPRRSRG